MMLSLSGLVIEETVATEVPLLALSRTVALASAVTKLAKLTSVTLTVKDCEVVLLPSEAITVTLYACLVS